MGILFFHNTFVLPNNNFCQKAKMLRQHTTTVCEHSCFSWLWCLKLWIWLLLGLRLYMVLRILLRLLCYSLLLLLTFAEKASFSRTGFEPVVLLSDLTNVLHHRSSGIQYLQYNTQPTQPGQFTGRTQPLHVVSVTIN